MDEHVKARLIGATVLVVIAVALVPELLSGPKRGASDTGRADGKRSVVIDLGGAASSAARVQPAQPAPTAPRDTPRLPTVEAPGVAAEQGKSATDVADGGKEADSAPAVKPAATVAASELIPPPPSPKPAPVETKPATSAAAGWAVQVGAFGSAETARKLVSDLKKDGLPAYVAPLNRNGKTLHRVRVGPAPTRADADKLAAQLKGRGLPASVVSGA